MDFQAQLDAAEGYADLGMNKESLAVLTAIQQSFPDKLDHPGVLNLQIGHLYRTKKWRTALKISRRLCKIRPDIGTGYLHAGFCLRKLKKIRAAKTRMLAGPSSLEKESMYHYNLACCECSLGNLAEARRYIKTAFKMDKNCREIAKHDKDLKPLWKEF